jgi:hypothetical protein
MYLYTRGREHTYTTQTCIDMLCRTVKDKYTYPQVYIPAPKRVHTHTDWHTNREREGGKKEGRDKVRSVHT